MTAAFDDESPDALMQRLGVNRLEPGPERFYAGLPKALEDSGRLLDLQEASVSVGTSGAGEARKQILAANANVIYYLSMNGTLNARQTILHRTQRTFSAPLSMYQVGVKDLGDWGFTIGPEHIFFCRRNCGVYVFSKDASRSSMALAHQIDRVLREGEVVEKAQLPRLLPKMGELRTSATTFSAGDTVRFELDAGALMQEQWAVHYVVDQGFLRILSLKGPRLEARGLVPGKTSVVVSLVHKANLLCASKTLELTIEPAKDPTAFQAADEDLEDE